MSSETRGTIRRLITALALLAVGFVAGWMVSNRLGISSGEAEQVRGVASHGDASRRRGKKCSYDCVRFETVTETRCERH